MATEYGGEWGVHRTISRFGAAPVPGKAVYVTVPAPAEALVAVRATVPQVAEEIRGLLAERGIRRVQLSADRAMAVVCVRAGMHVWIRDGSLSSCIPAPAVSGIHRPTGSMWSNAWSATAPTWTPHHLREAYGPRAVLTGAAERSSRTGPGLGPDLGTTGTSIPDWRL